MNKIAYRLMIVSIMLVLVLSSMPVSFAEGSPIQPFADTEFAITTANLTSSKSVIFSLATYRVKKSISVDSCWLEKKVNGDWTYVCSLPAPTKVNTNTFAFNDEIDYSEYIGTGTYQVGAVFTADDHSISRYSNEKTF